MDENDSILNPDLVVKIETLELTTEQLQDKIRALSTTSEGEDLRYAMRDLKKAILANPSACALLLPEDIGEMVKHLRRMTEPDIEKQNVKKVKKEVKTAMNKILKPSDFSTEELKEISDDDFI